MGNPDQTKTCTWYSHRENLKRAKQARENLRLLETRGIWLELDGREASTCWYRQQLRQWRGLMVYWMMLPSKAGGSTSTARRLTTRSYTVSAL